MTILYFTATGNSLYVAKSLGGQLLSIPQMIKENRYEFTDSKIGIVFPLYEWSVPSLVADFLKKSTFNTEYLFALPTYGIFSCGIASHLIDIADNSGYKFSYINKILMVDTWLPGFDMQKQIESEHKKKIESQISVIKQDVESSKNMIISESIFRKTATKLMLRYIDKKLKKDTERGIKKTYYIENTCVQCGTCVKVCPTNNITLDSENNSILLQNLCISCYSCLQNCPKNAIHLKNQKSRNRYRNKHVSLAEIINANNFDNQI